MGGAWRDRRVAAGLACGFTRLCSCRHMLSNQSFCGRVVVLGHGTVSRCALPMLMGIAGLPADRYLVIDRADRRQDLARAIALGLRFERRTLARDNMAATLGDLVRPGDLLLNLSVGIDSLEVADWCHHHGVVCVDTAIEPWEDHIGDASVPVDQRTDYAFHERARRMVRDRWRRDGPTAVVTQGANPGLVSSFAKAALLELAAHVGHRHAPPAGQADWARLARDLKVRVVHIAERDTQVADRPKQVGEFVNTWSIPGFVEEAMMPAEAGWGSHERTLPPGGRVPTGGPAHTIYVEKPAAEYLLRSWVPQGGQIAGFALPHSECITISHYLTLEEDGAVAYRPTVAFVYMPCDAALASLHEMMMGGWQMPQRERILADEIVGGMDELGVMLLGDGPTGWWYGSQLDIAEARRLIPGSNATAIQVAAGAVAGAVWAARNPARGFCEPEDLPHEEVLAIARPWLGTMVSQPTDWTPLKQRARLFDEPWVVQNDPWQFANFLIG